MIELPESLTLSAQMNAALTGKEAASVLPPTKPHKFCWFNGEPTDYQEQLAGSKVTGAEGFGIFAELTFDNGRKLCVNDGVNPRLVTADQLPKDYQLAILFTDETALVLTVAMYGGIILHDGTYDNEYYLKSRAALSPFSQDFRSYYDRILSDADQTKPNLSAKALLATEQRFPGIGNGVMQDILFRAGVHPKRKLATLTQPDRDRIYEAILSALREMTEKGGRDTEKDLYDSPGGYTTQMSKNTLKCGCPICGGPITKEAYLGGSVYYCPVCQKL